MFFKGTHKELASSLESIGAAFAIFEIRANGVSEIISANTLFEEVSCRPLAECIGRTLAEIIPRYVEKPMRGFLERCLAEQSPQEGELIIEREGNCRWWRLVASPVLPSKDSRGQRVIATLIEITEKKRLEQELEISRQRFEAVVQTAYDGVISIDEKQTIKMMNEAARYIFGVSDDSVIGSNLSRFLPQRFRGKHPGYVASFRNSSVDARPMQSRSPVIGMRANGTEFPLEVTISKIRVGNEIEMTAVIRDITERVRLIEELSRAATHDHLTGVFNRRHGIDALRLELARCVRFHHSMSIMMFDLDHFKVINDEYGHACGDQVLVSIVETIAKTLREVDVLCRWGGEEFLALLPGTSGDDAFALAERAREFIARKPIMWDSEQVVKITASFGVATYTDDSLTVEQLLERADSALYQAKELGRNRSVLSTVR